MIYLEAFLKFFFIGIALILGIWSSIRFVVKWISIDVYEAENLLKPFKEYLKKITEEEKYEDIKELQEIIKELEKDKVPKIINQYIIQKKYSIEWIDNYSISGVDKQGPQTLGLIKKYIVLGKVVKEEKKKTKTNKTDFIANKF